MSDEFNQLAIKFNDSYLPQYAGLCWYGAAKCQRILENSPAEIDFLLKSARAFVRADQKMEDLMINSSDREHLEVSSEMKNKIENATNNLIYRELTEVTIKRWLKWMIHRQ